MSSDPTVSRSVAAWLLDVVNGMSVKVSAPDFVEAAQLAAQAKAELEAIVGADAP